MRKIALVLIAVAFVFATGSICLAESGQGQTGQMGSMMQSRHNMMGQGMMGAYPMGRGMMNSMPMWGMMGKAMVPTEDGGVVVMIGNKLYKYDKNLKLKKQAEIPVDYKNLKNMMMQMRQMGMEMPSEKKQ